MKAKVLLFFLFFLLHFTLNGVLARLVKISNKNPRRTTSGDVVDAHDGNVVFVNGTYFLYGEHYGPTNYAVPGNALVPKLVVYTSTDMVSWEWQGFLHNNTNPGWDQSPHWPHSPNGTWWSPCAVYSEARRKVILWFTASPGECCDAYFGVAQSDDGIHFELISLSLTPASGASVDGSAVLIDDDGTGYVAFTAMNAPGQRDHVVAIERLADDLLSTTRVQVAPYFPDYFVEGVMLFKRAGRYYVMYGSCCCACREGSGAVVYSALSISGPWTRQDSLIGDLNCAGAPTPNASLICAGMPAEPPLARPTGFLTIPAQGIGLSVIPTSASAADGNRNVFSSEGGGEAATFLWSGQRWLSAPHNPPRCENLCTAAEGDCQQDPQYRKGEDFDYWIPLEFDASGRIAPFRPFVDEFELDIN